MHDITVSADAWLSVHEQCSRLRDELADTQKKLRIQVQKFETLIAIAYVLCDECGERIKCEQWNRKFPPMCGEYCAEQSAREHKEDYYGELARNEK